MNSKKMLVTVGLVVMLVSPSFGASLWINGRDLYSMQGGREFKVGDIVTVTVSEQATAQQAATTNTNDNTSLEVKTSPSIPFFSKVVDRFTGKNEVKNTWNGNGTTTRSGKLDGTVTAKVVEVLPNGNLLIEGSRDMRVNKETQLMKVRGIVRPQDIDSKNTVPSKLLADAEIKYEGKGSVGSTQRPGLMTKISNWLF
ncbi:MAG: flagellar basal body L-ring protein FlgH [Candidatus Ozemobacteraceae bacterium]